MDSKKQNTENERLVGKTALLRQYGMQQQNAQAQASNIVTNESSVADFIKAFTDAAKPSGPSSYTSPNPK